MNNALSLLTISFCIFAPIVLLAVLTYPLLKRHGNSSESLKAEANPPEQIRRILQGRDTEDLLKIWVKGDRQEWTAEAFEAIRQILMARNVSVPNQGMQVVGGNRSGLPQAAQGQAQSDDVWEEYRRKQDAIRNEQEVLRAPRPDRQHIGPAPLASRPPSPKWFIGVLTAVWPIELTFACILAASVAVVVWGAEPNPLQIMGIAALVGAIGYLFGNLAFRSPKLRSAVGSGWWWGDIGCWLLILGIALAAYYVVVASICRHIILPITFRIAGISSARIPSVFEGL